MTSALSGLDPAGAPFPFSFWMDLATVARNLLAWALALALLCLPRARDTLRLTASPLVLKCSNSMRLSLLVRARARSLALCCFEGRALTQLPLFFSSENS